MCIQDVRNLRITFNNYSRLLGTSWKRRDKTRKIRAKGNFANWCDELLAARTEDDGQLRFSDDYEKMHMANT